MPGADGFDVKAVKKTGQVFQVDVADGSRADDACLYGFYLAVHMWYSSLCHAVPIEPGSVYAFSGGTGDWIPARYCLGVVP